MRGDNHPQRVLLRQAREDAVAELSEAFAQDQLSLEEFEQRVDRVQSCADVAQLRALTQDLALTPDALRVRVAPLQAQAVEDDRRRGAGTLVRAAGRRTRALAILGSTERRIQTLDGGALQAVSVLGNVELDLRGLELPEGVTEVFVTSVLGNIEIIVSPEMAVDADVLGVLGSFEGPGRHADARADRSLRIRGVSVLGSVEVRARPARPR